MSLDLTQSDRIALEAAEAKALAAEIIAGASHQSEFDAGAILESHPALARFPSIVVDLAYEEYCRQMDAGKRADPQQFVRRFPAVADSLLKVLEVHDYIERHPNTFAAEPTTPWPKAGEELAGFALVREIGRGGFARVFLAREKRLGNREVVVKICRQANEEAARLGQLEHPHIVPVHSVQTEHLTGFTIICMPYLGSATLADVMAEIFADEDTRGGGADILEAVARTHRRHNFPTDGRDSGRQPAHWTLRRGLRRGSYAEAIVEIGAGLCEALDYAHRQGICHCDVKPSNILLTIDGRSLLLDFNLSMQRGGAAAVVGGTLPYMAPEQLQFLLAASPESLPQIDYRADLFSVGVTMFQLLTGKLPYPAEDLPEDRTEAARRLITQQRSQAGLHGELEQVVSPAIAGVIADCLAFDRDDRPTTAEQVVRRLRHDLRPLPRARRWVRLHKVAVNSAAFVLVFAALAIAAGLASIPPHHIRQYQAGVACLDAGDFPAAVRYFTDTIETRKDFASQALLLRGWAHLKAAQEADKSKRTGLLESARRDFEVSWNATKNAASEASLACYAAEASNTPQATNRYSEAVEKGLRTPRVLNNLGYYLTNNVRELDRAVDVLSIATRADSAFMLAHYNLARAELLRGNAALNDAGCCRRKALEQRAAQNEAEADRLEQFAAKYAAEAPGAFAAAITHIEAARQLVPRSAEVEFAAARIFVGASLGVRGDPDQERNLLENALSACQSAVELKLWPDKLKELTLLAPQLNDDPRFRALMTKPRPAEAAQPIKLTVDIFPDIRDHLFAMGRQ